MLQPAMAATPPRLDSSLPSAAITTYGIAGRVTVIRRLFANCQFPLPLQVRIVTSWGSVALRADRNSNENLLNLCSFWRHSVPSHKPERRSDRFCRPRLESLEDRSLLAPLADIVNVAPDPRSIPVGQVIISFTDSITGLPT